ncbi:hypothetical protein U1Q18_045502, partial [Sarracenia purpurea var. burkii]
ISIRNLEVSIKLGINCFSRKLDFADKELNRREKNPKPCADPNRGDFGADRRRRLRRFRRREEEKNQSPGEEDDSGDLGEGVR